jgi:hypothetical protein
MASNGEAGIDFPIVIVGIGEVRWIDGAEQQSDRLKDRGFTDVAAA